ncbi:tRNA (cytidine(34)-2'-O)-methyltransferase [Roseospira visakhapatnamensis]|uniref:tRNA (cytidine(34)-2'-O)-methyltransferase n=1 Tax=Roseospira visakhapatnamensis TaxID=390880 RepID=A0A7W6RB71_9PROT|nr:tRNA (cytidine(34)-2'-O)-methyltransferase [Roseospira visakhapatnamensis]MBB4264643.1 tRNA (cytidine/uridine-2'-O-)-methyltransferase [Roseospira visakhapatnamensis]
MRLALFQPDMPQNTAAVLRLGACLGLPVEIIEPCGFLWDDKRLRRIGMDYLETASCRRHAGWNAFRQATDLAGARLVLLTTGGAVAHVDHAFRPDDVLLLGRESAGVPDAVHQAVDARVTVPMAPGARSLNVVLAAAMVAGEALRQTGGFPHGCPASKTSDARR